MRIHSAAFPAAQRWLAAALLVACSGAAIAASPDGIWDDVEETAIARSSAQRIIVPERYRTLRINNTQLQRMLSTVPMERDVAAHASDTTLTLPLPEGGYGEFRVVESPIMEPELAARYPQLREEPVAWRI